MSTATLVRTKRVTIKRGEGDAWFVTIEGNGYPADFDVASVDLVKLRNDGSVIHDPHGWCDLYGPAELREPWNSQAAMDADSAGYGGVAFHGALAGDNGMSFDDADTFGEIEVAYLMHWGPGEYTRGEGEF